MHGSHSTGHYFLAHIEATNKRQLLSKGTLVPSPLPLSLSVTFSLVLSFGRTAPPSFLHLLHASSAPRVLGRLSLIVFTEEEDSRLIAPERARVRVMFAPRIRNDLRPTYLPPFVPLAPPPVALSPRSDLPGKVFKAFFNELRVTHGFARLDSRRLGRPDSFSLPKCLFANETSYPPALLSDGSFTTRRCLLERPNPDVLTPSRH